MKTPVTIKPITNPEIINIHDRKNRDRGIVKVSGIGVAALVAATALLTASVVRNSGDDNADGQTTTTETSNPNTSVSPTISGTASGNVAGRPVETSPPLTPTTTVAAGGNLVPAGPITKSYPFVSGNGEPKSMDCNGIPVVVDATFFKGGFSPFVGIDDVFPQELTELRRWNVSLANAIVDGSGDIVPALDWDMTAVNVDNLHSPTDPNQPGRFAVVSACYIDGVEVIPPYIAA